MSEAADMAKDFMNVPQDQATPTTSFIGSSILLIVMYFILGFVSDSYNAKSSDNGFRRSLKLPIMGIFFLIILALQFGVNLSATVGKCGSPQYSYAIWYTLFPNLIYTGVVILLLKIFPGFKSVFSNTIGYFIIGLSFVRGGIKKAFNKLMLPPSNDSLVKKVYTDESELVNLMTPNIHDFYKRMQDYSKIFYQGAVVFKPDVKAQKKGIKRNIIDINNSAAKKDIKRLFALILIKDYVGEFMWLFLTTLVVTATSFNFILGIDNCSKDQKTLEMAKELNKMAEKKGAKGLAKGSSKVPVQVVGQ